MNGTALLVTPFTTAVTSFIPTGTSGTCTAIEFTVQVVTVAGVDPNRISLLPWLAPKDAPTPGIMVTELPTVPAAGLTHAICKAAFELTTREIVVVADKLCEAPPAKVPWMVMVEVPACAELLAKNDSTVLPVVELGVNDAVTPDGTPDALKVTAPVNPLMSFTVIVSVAPAFGETVTVFEAGVSVKLPEFAAFTVSAICALAVVLPEVPVMVRVEVPAAAVLLAVSVNALLLMAGLVPNEAETPFGSPEMERLTLPLNEPVSTIVIVSAPLFPSVNDRDVLEGASTKLPDDFAAIVSAMVVEAVNVPDVPVIVTTEVPGVAELLAVNVITLLVVAGLVLNAAVTPLGKPDTASDTAPVKPLTSVTAMVSLPVPPTVTERVLADGASVKLPPVPPPLPPHVTPFKVKEVGTELVELFHVPLKPSPVRLPPAGMLPL